MESERYSVGRNTVITLDIDSSTTVQAAPEKRTPYTEEINEDKGKKFVSRSMGETITSSRVLSLRVKSRFALYMGKSFTL